MIKEKTIEYYQDLDKKINMIPLTSDYLFKAVFSKHLELLKKFLFSTLDLGYLTEETKISLTNNELPKENKKEYQKRVDIYVVINDKFHIDIELNKSYFKHIKLRNYLYADKIYSLILESGENKNKLEDRYFIQLNLNAKEKQISYGEDVIVPYGLNSKTVYLDTNCTVLKYLEYYRGLYYNKNVRNEEVIWLTSLTASSFEELYKILSHILSSKEIKTFMEEVERLSMDGFSIHEWEKEKLDALVERQIKKDGREEGRKERNIEIAKKMLEEKSDIGFISKVTGLSEEEVKDLSKLK